MHHCVAPATSRNGYGLAVTSRGVFWHDLMIGEKLFVTQIYLVDMYHCFLAVTSRGVFMWLGLGRSG